MSQNNQAQPVAIRTTPPTLVWAQGQDKVSALRYTRQFILSNWNLSLYLCCSPRAPQAFDKAPTSILSWLPVHTRMSKEVLNCRQWGVPMSLTEVLPTPSLASLQHKAIASMHRTSRQLNIKVIWHTSNTELLPLHRGMTRIGFSLNLD